MRTLLLLAMAMLFAGACFAAPAPPLESDLKRAETVFVAKVVAKEATKTTFEVVSVLRGKVEGKMRLTLDRGEGCPDLPLDALCLLVSQGDDHFGKPRAMAGRPMDGQGVWCGWLVLSMSAEFVEGIFSFADGQPFSDGPVGHPHLTLDRVKSLVGRFPYEPHIHDKE